MLFGFSIVLLLIVILGIYNFFAVNKVNDDMRYLADEQVSLLMADERLAFNAAERLATVRGYLLYGDQEFVDLFYQYTEESEQYQNDVLALTDSQEVKDLIDKSIEWRNFVIDNVIDEYQNGNEEEALNNLASSTELAREIKDGFKDMSLERETIVDKTANNVISSGKTTLLVGLIVSILVVIIGIVAALITSNVISRPIQTVMERMKLIAEGDLSKKPLETKLKDEVGQLIVAANEMN